MNDEYRLFFSKGEVEMKKIVEQNFRLIQERNENISNSEILKFSVISFIDEFTDDRNDLINIDKLAGFICSTLRFRKNDFSNETKRFLSSFADKLSYKDDGVLVNEN